MADVRECDISRLWKALEGKEIFVHDASGDLAAILNYQNYSRLMKLSPQYHIFDTKLAAEILGEEKELCLYSARYATPQEIKDKKDMQRYDWGKKKYSDKAIEYAKTDAKVSYVKGCDLKQKLTELPDRWQWMAETQKKRTFDIISGKKSNKERHTWTKKLSEIGGKDPTTGKWVIHPRHAERLRVLLEYSHDKKSLKLREMVQHAKNDEFLSSEAFSSFPSQLQETLRNIETIPESELSEFKIQRMQERISEIAAAKHTLVEVLPHSAVLRDIVYNHAFSELLPWQEKLLKSTFDELGIKYPGGTELIRTGT